MHICVLSSDGVIGLINGKDATVKATILVISPYEQTAWLPWGALAARRRSRFFCHADNFWEYIKNMTVNNIHEAAGGLVISNPEVLGGKPVFRGTRMPVSTLFEYLADGLSLDYFLESFPSVTREQAVGVLLYGQRRIEEELAA